ncbi:MAG: sugar phosphate isomerase/epimerase [bacterium]|nr:sugar phosphate isomerase/epimerase [bacterium]
MNEKTTQQFTVFTKPWPEKSLPVLAQFVKELGFDGVELPVRPGYPVTPEHVEKILPEAAKIFAVHGLKIGSIAGTASKTMIAACAEAGVPLIRIMARVNPELNYRETEMNFRKEFDGCLPALEEAGVALGVQNHAGNFIGSAIGILRLVEQYDPKQIGIVLDLAHCSLAGEPVPIALDIAWSHLLLVNLKNGYWQRIGESEIGEARWKNYWTGSKDGLTSWHEAAVELTRRKYQGDICITAEYSAPKSDDSVHIENLVAKDFAYAKTLF